MTNHPLLSPIHELAGPSVFFVRFATDLEICGNYVWSFVSQSGVFVTGRAHGGAAVTWPELRKELSTYTLHLKTGDNGAFCDDLRKLVLALLELNVSERQCSNVIQVLGNICFSAVECRLSNVHLQTDTGSVQQY